jgi:DNA repair exonuclease SbcCD nuclease subunit
MLPMNAIERAIQLLKEYVMREEDHGNFGAKFETTGIRSNYDHPNKKIQLPIYLIHGNHDRSSTSKASSLDLLHQAGLVNV